MKCYGHKTPKRSSMWSNSKKVYKFRTSKLKRSNKYTYSNLVKRYRNKEGKARFVGNRKALKNSAIPGEICVGFVVCMSVCLGLVPECGESTCNGTKSPNCTYIMKSKEIPFGIWIAIPPRF